MCESPLKNVLHEFILASLVVWVNRQMLQNTPTASLQMDKTPPTSDRFMTLNKLMMRLQFGAAAVYAAAYVALYAVFFLF